MAILYDINNNVIEHHNLQDKLHWCLDGESKERAFVRRWGAQVGYDINPEKENDPFAPDLISLQSQKPTDLKSQHSPFFKAGEFYGIEPTYAVVFNVKDKLRYQEYYPDIDILYYVDWIAIKATIKNKDYSVNSLRGIYRIPFQDLLTILDADKVHEYGQRMNDTRGNARNSYVLDIRNPAFERLL